ncbi:NlpC/P60 family protein [Sphingomonas sp. BIUV-7]|uniref:NlpC/P60 family protein n=1 Tax=Sphingomonas natans TaxID=3063330 RepID=A0ABT8YBG4_9SPHN|nr:NlpC/P60 family protein [Sphingomonas sp. BIUV-7]MDO6415676.1 NlpC/P60 family protein [Sphingomonas sp. BIUV-7]
MADIALAQHLFAPHYAAATRCHVTAASCPIFAEPSSTARAVSQLVLGEGFDIFDVVAGWAWGRCAHDDYVGYLPVARLGPIADASHRIAVPSALVFASPDIKAPVLAHWPIGARFAGTENGAFLETEAGFVHMRHALPLDARRDLLATATALIGQPYLWGGRGGGGIDCSGLVQVACDFAGIAAPRDSDMQREGLGTKLDPDAPALPGDLVFFPGHVGLMLDETRLIHANAFAMAVAVEPLVDVVARLHQEPAPILKRRRIA